MKKIYRDSDQRKVLEIDFLPPKYCTFSVFCPIGRLGEQAEKVFRCEETSPLSGSMAVSPLDRGALFRSTS